MAVPNRYILHQAPVIAAMGQSLLSALFRKASGSGGAPKVPGPEIAQTISPRPKDLVRLYVKQVGGDASAYKRTLPPHLFPQWGFPLATRVLAGLDYPMAKVLNAGCHLEARQPLPNNEPLNIRAPHTRLRIGNTLIEFDQNLTGVKTNLYWSTAAVIVLPVSGCGHCRHDNDHKNRQ